MTTICPDAGRLRAWLDGEDRADSPPNGRVEHVLTATTLTGPALENHLAACTTCQTTLAALERDADHAARALATHDGPPTAEETEVALARLRSRLADDVGADTAADLIPCPPSPRSIGLPHALAQEATASQTGSSTLGERRPIPHTGEESVVERSTARRAPMPITLVWRRWRLALAGAAAALALTFTLATPEGQTAAAGFLAQFRSQKLAIVAFDASQARQSGLFRFERLGTITNSQPARWSDVATAQEASSRAGFPVLQPDPSTLPAGTARTPKIRFSPASETRLTFDKQKARDYFDSINRKDLSLPDTLHGSTLVVGLPPMVVLEYASADNKPGVMIGEAREVQVGVEGNASLDDVRGFLLGLPNVPPDLARQLRSMQDWTTTLPIPVPVDKMTWQETTIAGASGYILNDNTGLGSGVIWQRDGRILGVAGPVKATDLRRIAESLK